MSQVKCAPGAATPERADDEAIDAVQSDDTPGRRRDTSPRGWFRIMGKIRRLGELVEAKRLSVNHREIATAIALVAERYGLRLCTPDLRHWVAWAGFRIDVDAAQEILVSVRHRRLAAERAGRRFAVSQVELGRLLEVTAAIRDEIEFWGVVAIDEPNEAGRVRRKIERDAARTADERSANETAAADRRERRTETQRERRRANGIRPREEYEATSASRTQPWRWFDVSRDTWERHGKPNPADGICRCPTCAKRPGRELRAESVKPAESLKPGGLKGGKMRVAAKKRLDARPSQVSSSSPSLRQVDPSRESRVRALEGAPPLRSTSSAAALPDEPPRIDASVTPTSATRRGGGGVTIAQAIGG